MLFLKLRGTETFTPASTHAAAEPRQPLPYIFDSIKLTKLGPHARAETWVVFTHASKFSMFRQGLPVYSS